MKRKGEVFQQVEKALGKDLKEALKEMRQKGLSASQMYEELSQETRVKFTKRSLQRWIKSLGIVFSQQEAGILRWKNGLMAGAMKKSRHAIQEAGFKGSRIEEQIRWILKNELESLQNYETIVGFSNWTILDNLEIDIPIVCIHKSTQLISKFALEIDGDYFHKDETRWDKKKTQILNHGWHPLHIVIHKQELSRKAHQVYVKNNIRSLVDIDSLIAEINNILKT